MRYFHEIRYDPLIDWLAWICQANTYNTGFHQYLIIYFGLREAPNMKNFQIPNFGACLIIPSS
jgi:hypothetical protein